VTAERRREAEPGEGAPRAEAAPRAAPGGEAAPHGEPGGEAAPHGEPGGEAAPRIEHAGVADLLAVVEDRREFWGDRQLPALHHPLLIYEFGQTAFVVRGEDGRVLAYLFGLLTPRGVGYVHVVAVRRGHRRGGLARALYERFAGAAREHGARSLKAFTRPENATSIAFHRAQGFGVTVTPDYAGPGETRVVFTREL